MRGNCYVTCEALYHLIGGLVRGFKGIACTYQGPQTERVHGEFEDECYECYGTGTNEELDEEPEDVPTGRAIVVMVGDDAKHVVDFEDLSPVDEDDVCTCGQLGCWSNNNTMGGES